MKQPRDSQRTAVYRWERGFATWPGDKLSLAECRELIWRVWSDHLDSEPPTIGDGRGRRSACYIFEDHQIRLPRWSRTEYVVLHEVAHGLVWAMLPRAAAHGEEFARLYLDLLGRYAEIDVDLARAAGEQQRPRRVRFGQAGIVPPRRQLRLFRLFGLSAFG